MYIRVKIVNMASAKKTKKKKGGTTLSLGAFLGDEASQVVTKSWADEMESMVDAEENDFGGPPKVVINRAALPTAPRAARGPNVDLSLVPNEPPFTAYIGNLPFDSTQEEVERFFKGIKIVGVRLPTEMGRAKGFGYAEFEDRQALIDALSLNEATMRNRPIRIDLASHNNQGERGGDRRDGDRDRRRDDDDKTLGDWRGGRKEERPSEDRFSGGRERRDDFDRDRQSDRDGRDRYGDRNDRREGFRGDRGGRFEDRGRNDDRDRGRFDSRDKDDFSSRSSFGFRDRDRNDRFGPPRDRDRNGERSGGFRDGDRGGRFNDDRPRDNNWGRDGGERHRDSEDRFRDGGRDRNRDDADRGERGRDIDNKDWHREAGERRERSKDDEHRREVPERRDQGSDHVVRDRDHRPQDSERRRSPERSRDSSKDRPSASDGPKERPRLKLQPRTKPIEEAGKITDTGAGASIFGGAKPVDTAAREREIEERLKKKSHVSERENRSSGDDERSYPNRTSVSSPDGSKQEDPYKSRSSGSERVRKESSSSSTHETSKKERHSSRSSSHKADHDEGSDHEGAEVVRKSSKKSNAEKQQPVVPVKLVPAPPPKENIWEKRKTEILAPKVPQQTPSTGTIASTSSSSADSKFEPSSPIETVVEQLKDVAVIEEDQSDSVEAEPNSRTESVLPTDTPKVNVWDARKKEMAMASRAPEKTPAPSAVSGLPSRTDAGPAPVRKTATVSVAAVTAAGRGGGGQQGGRRAEVDTHSSSAASSSRQKREKPLPSSIEEMPKLQDKGSKDWSNANKFSTLLDNEEESTVDDAED